MTEIIKLEEIRKLGTSALAEASKRLNSGRQKLDCTDLYNLEQEELNALFSAIPWEWKKWQELSRFMEMSTLTEDLRLVIKEYLDRLPRLSDVFQDREKIIKLEEIRQLGKSKLAETSKLLNSGCQKLDCTDVYNLEQEELNALFSAIPWEWKKWQELSRFMEMSTLTEDLRLVIKEYLDRLPRSSGVLDHQAKVQKHSEERRAAARDSKDTTPVGINEKGRKFIETEPIGKDGEYCEQKVWDACKKAFSERECIGYWGYPIFSKTGESRKEPDILIVDKELGLVIIEVKSITIDQIVSVDGHSWQFQNFYQTQGNPYQQAENQLYSLLSYCDREEIIRRQVRGRAIVALPLISEREWQEKGFDRLPSCPPIIFKEHLGTKSLISKIEQSPLVQSGKNLSDEQWELLLAVVGGTPVLRKTLSKSITVAQNNQTRSSVINQLGKRLYELDLQQQHIGLEIPPGAQRIRGIAGSGKTVLLAQKAANMHLKHPDWDIALVFFTRSLYDQIEDLVDKWIRHYSCEELDYKNNIQAQSKLRILHAWGAKDRKGFYRTICEEHNRYPLRVNDTNYRQPNEGLADICKRLIKEADTQPMFDAVLVDEGQDLVVNPEELKYEDKQAIYWMAYKSLRSCDPEQPEQRRLIWAYDEAQSLDTLKIPTTKELFGEELSQLISKGRQYKSGINKSEIMYRCYRTPGEILTAAHAIGMGLMRPEGMLSGLTRKDEWESIGYEVQGAFREGQEVTLHRPPANSPNPIPTLWGEPVIEFHTYSSRQEEFTVLAKNIKHNLEYDGLNPSRQILVLILGSIHEAIELENHVAEFLMQQGIDIFIPSGTRLNQLNPKYPDNDINYIFPDITDMRDSPDLQKILYTALTRAKLQAFIPLEKI